MRTLTNTLVVLALASGITVGGDRETAAPEATEPDPSLTPEQVIDIQLRALQNNSRLENDRGIEITFNFASPANRAMTGPLPRFISMVKNPPYSTMLDFESYDTAPIERDGERVQQRVTLLHKEGLHKQGRRAIFIWVLSKQKEAPYVNCWMTDGVIRVNPEDGPSQVAGVDTAVDPYARLRPAD